MVQIIMLELLVVSLLISLHRKSTVSCQNSQYLSKQKNDQIQFSAGGFNNSKILKSVISQGDKIIPDEFSSENRSRKNHANKIPIFDLAQDSTNLLVQESADQRS